MLWNFNLQILVYLRSTTGMIINAEIVQNL